MDTIPKRQRNGGLRKVCPCSRRKWPKCPHSWYFNFKARGGPNYRFSIDRELGKRVADKTTAQKEAEKIRVAIREGTFRRQAEIMATQPAATADAITLTAFGQTFLERAGRGATANNRTCLRKLTAFTLLGSGTLGDKPLGAITEDDIEAFFTHLRQQGRAASTANKYVQLCRALFRWAVRKKYLAQNPIADSEAIRREKMAQRSRRLAPDVVDAKSGKLTRAGEERALLAVAGPQLQRLIIGALETGMRLGELLRLQWRDVDLTGRRLTVRAENTKTRTERILPIPARLAAVLEMAHATLVATLPEVADAHQRAEHIARCYVFGDPAGRRVNIVRKSWDTAALKAHGQKPVWVGSNTLAPECRAALRAIDLHFHDLRHEAGSRLHEAGWPLHHVQQMLGHKSLEQTTTYLNVTLAGLQESMQRFDESVARCKPVANQGGIELAPFCNDESGDAAQHQIN